MKFKILNNCYYYLKNPSLNKTSDKNLFKKERIKKLKSAFIFKKKKICISKFGVPLANNREIVFDYLKFNSLSRFIFLKKIILLINFYMNFFKLYFKKKKIIQNAIIIHDRHSSNFYHWVTDVLPKLYFLKKKKFLKDNTILMPKFKTSFQKDSLSLFTQNYKIINNDLVVNNFTYLSEFHHSGSPRPKYIIRLKHYILRKINDKSKTSKYFYISRKFSKYRKIKNENQLIKFLKTKNFKIIYAEKINFKKQVSIFKNAKFIISSHGAGLTNLIWMKKKTKILEIRSFNIHQNSNFTLSKIFNINYFYFFAKQNSFNSNADYLLDMRAFKIYFNKILNF